MSYGSTSSHSPSAFNRLALSNLSSYGAQQIAMAAAPILAVTLLNATVGEVAWIQLAQMLPFLLFSLPAGVMADRVPAKRLLVSGELVRASALVAVMLVAMSGLLSMQVLVALCFLGSLGTLAYSVALPTLTVAFVERPALAAANAKIELLRSMAFIGGPALGGALIAWLGSSESLGAAALLSGLAIWSAATLPRVGEPKLEHHDFRAELVEGARFAMSEPRLRAALFMAVIYNAAFFLMQTALVPYATHNLGMTAAEIGLALSGYGGGMVVAGVMSPRLARTQPIGRMLAAGLLTAVTGALLMLATLYGGSKWLAAAFFFLFGAGGVLWAVGFTTLRQLVVPPGLIGRVTSLHALTTYGARPLGAAAAGVIGTAFGIEACLYAMAAAFLALLAMFYRSPLPRTVG